VKERTGGGTARPDEFVEDARGLLCPLPVIRLGERIREIPPGRTLLLLADDPAAEEDVRLWCRGHAHDLVSVEREGREVRLRIRRRRDSPPASGGC
jgi:tRNA 2-thiouridine synthesizing protein A